MERDVATEPRQRLSKSERHRQLLDTARELIRDEGTDTFTLGRLAERARVTKPLVYDHFGDRAGVLAELYREFESRQRDTLEGALRGAAPDLAVVSRLVAGAYIDCCLAEGRELADVVAALAGSATLAQVRQEAEDEYLSMCRVALEPLGGPLDTASLAAIVGAGDALARRALDGSIDSHRARATLTQLVAALCRENTQDARTTER